jgi:transcription termination factor Rho
MAQQEGSGRSSTRSKRPKKGGGGNRGGQRGGSRRRGRRRSRGGNQGQGVPKYNPEDLVPAEGVLDVTRDGYGFLRNGDRNYLESAEDVFVPVSLIRKNALMSGSLVIGSMAPSKRAGQKPALAEIATVDGAELEVYRRRTPFRDLTVIDPNEWFRLEGPENDDMTLRVIDLVSPIGKGQRTLIVAPPRTGKTVMLQRVGQAIKKNFPDVHLMVLLINERPEEVTEFKRSIDGEVVSSSLRRARRSRHVQGRGHGACAKAQRLVEEGRDVVVLLDSAHASRRAPHNTRGARSSGQDACRAAWTRGALRDVRRRFFGAARNIEEGGSLTIIATALIDTGSRMDEVIFEEFKGTGNSEIVLDAGGRRSSRTFPAIDVHHALGHAARRSCSSPRTTSRRCGCSDAC